MMHPSTSLASLTTHLGPRMINTRRSPLRSGTGA